MAIVKCMAITTKPKKAIAYIINNEKTKDGSLVTGINISTEPELADNKMNVFREKFQSSNKTKANHIVHSFSDKENISPELANEISLEWYKRIFPENSLAVAATHIIRELEQGENCIHTHFIVNNVCTDGTKIRIDKEFLKRAKEISNEVCNEYGLKESIIKFEGKEPNKSWYEWSQEKQGNGWKETIREDIKNLINASGSFEDLLRSLEAKGYDIKQGKYISVRPPDKDRFVRLKTLGYYYTEENIKIRISKVKEQDLEGIGYREKNKKKYIDSDVYKFKYRKGSVGNILQLTALIVKTELGLNNNNKKTYTRHNYKSEKELEVIATALETVDKFKIDNREDIVSIYTDLEKELLKLSNWKTKAQKRISEIENIASKIEDVGKLKEKEIEVDERIKEDNLGKKELRDLAKVFDKCIEESKEKTKYEDKDNER